MFDDLKTIFNSYNNSNNIESDSNNKNENENESDNENEKDEYYYEIRQSNIGLKQLINKIIRRANRIIKRKRRIFQWILVCKILSWQ